MANVELDPDIAIRLKGLPRLGEIMLGLWLFASAFLWRHPHLQAMNMWILGLCVIGLAIVACAWPFARFVNAAIAAWLFASVFALPRLEPGGTLSDVLTAVALFTSSMVPTSWGPVIRQRPW